MKKLMAIIILCAMVILGIWWFWEVDEDVKQEAVARVLQDRHGATVNVIEDYDRIVSYAPAITESLVDLGYGDKIVAITTYDSGNGVVGEPLIFDMTNPDLEAIIALNPDLILTSELTAQGGADPMDELRNMGITVVNFPTPNSIDEIYLDLEFLGELLGVPEKAKQIVTDTKSQIANVSAITDGIENRKTVYFEISPAPYMYSTGGGTYLNEMISIAGGNNIFTNTEGWMSVTDEMVISANPDVIITNVNYVDNPIQEIKDRNGWAEINAVKNNEVFQVENNPTSLPTTNILKGIQEMAKDMYPDLFK
ncbi:hypothetical protein AN643_03055 [Candidatus Epulonipiscioides saccharophilum]|nr:hypothetical protein AN643_03055 [Epulopiscium sp. SCG-B10WGA-EpuloB]